jgi:ATP-dependent helicase/nuclease subunit B
MTSIAADFGSETEQLPPQPWPWAAQESAAACWQAWAREASAWLSANHADPREALIVVPVGAVLAQARQAWVEAVGGWVPRIDTIAAVSASLAWCWDKPAQPLDADLPWVTLDAVVDRLQAARSLGGQAWGKQWAQRDRRGFEFALDQVVDAAHTWVRRMQAMAPAQRSAYAEAVRALVAPPLGAGPQGPGGRERLLLAWALEWAIATALAGLPADPLFDMRPSAFISVSAGEAVSPGTEAHLMLGVMRHLARSGVPACWMAAQATPQLAREQAPVLVACTDAEDEAQQAAAQVLAAVNAARATGAAQAVSEAGAVQPVALIALDRSLIRRVRAMLEGAGAQIADETGWRLSTTRAAAVLSRLIQASHPRASTDDLLDWLKSGWLDWAEEGCAANRPVGATLASASGQLERWCRRHGMLGAWGLQLPAAEPGLVAPQVAQVAQAGQGAQADQLVPEGRQGLPASAVALMHWARHVVAPLQALWTGKRASLQAWLAALTESLARCGSRAALQADPAGELALQSLRFADEAGGDQASQAWLGLAHQTHLDGMAFMRWVAAVLEATTFRPAAPDTPPDVVITPMARAVLRPFAAIVLPGSDERQLGAMGSQSGWLSTRLCEAMNLATPQSLRAAQWDAFSLLMTRPNVICLYRQAQGSEPLEPSAWLERWSGMEGARMARVADSRPSVAVPMLPVHMPQPSLGMAAWAVPEKASATSYEAMRQCPYRFFATSVLGLRESDELDEGLDRSDFGVWLHEVLRLFHEARQQQLAIHTPEDDVRQWLEAALQATHLQGLDRDSQRPYFMPYQADLERLAQAYVRWLGGHEAQGWVVRATESEAHRMLDLAGGRQLKLYGQLDRVDVRHEGGASQQFVIDYKTGSLDGLKAKVALPEEDTQLAFYAALSAPQGPVEAAYLHLDAKAVTPLAHADVQASAELLLEGLQHDWNRLHAGAALPALGEGAACGFCQARGLCRKDHWTMATPQEEAAP